MRTRQSSEMLRAGLPTVEEDVYQAVLELKENIEVEAAEVQDFCLQYQETIVYAHLRQPPAVTSRMVQRWKDELANRRQYLSYLKQMEGSFKQAASHAEQLTRMLLNEMEALKDLVGTRTSVPKEQVPPAAPLSAPALQHVAF